MSLDELRNDLKANLKAANQIVDPITRDYMKNTIWPWLDSLLEVVEEMDDAVGEIVDQQEDYLQAETAGIFAAVIQGGLGLSAELRKTASPDMVAKLDAYDALCAQAMQVLTDVTMLPTDEIDKDDEEEEGEDA